MFILWDGGTLGLDMIMVAKNYHTVFYFFSMTFVFSEYIVLFVVSRTYDRVSNL